MALVIDRDLRTEYLDALLRPLVDLFAAQERRAILQALSVDAKVEIAFQKSLTDAAIERLAAKLGKKHRAQTAELRKVNPVAEALRQRARDHITRALKRIEQPLAEVHGPDPAIVVVVGGPDYNNAYWYRRDVVELAKEDQRFANFDEAHFFVKASLRAGMERLVFVASFHHVGHDLSGVMEATAFAQLESFENSDESDATRTTLVRCSPEAFPFTYRTKSGDIAALFDAWLDQALAVAVKEFGDRL